MRFILWGALGAIALFLIGGGIWIWSLPPEPAAKAMPPIAREEADATTAALKPPKRRRPLIAIIGINDATETTDYLIPYGILRRADIAEVVAVATGPGNVKLFPALTVQPQTTIIDFDAAHPDGADYVIVPAMSRDDDLAALQWIKAQAAKGATIVSVCAGAKIVANAGLLDGKRATTHWYFVDEVLKSHPSIRYVPDRRLVVDGKVATTTGISASISASLTLIEAIAGRAKAVAVARDLGVASWDARHDSAAFKLTRPFAMTVLQNRLAIWSHEKLGIALAPGIDEVSLALVADAWSRTYRSRAVTFAAADDAQQSRNGLRIMPDQVAKDWPGPGRLAVGDRPAEALDRALADISSRYGQATTDVVAKQLEYPRQPAPR